MFQHVSTKLSHINGAIGLLPYYPLPILQRPQVEHYPMVKGIYIHQGRKVLIK